MTSVPRDREPSETSASAADRDPGVDAATVAADDASAGKRGTLVKLAGWTMIARVVAQAAQFSGFVIAARFLGPADFGLFSLVYLFTTILTLVASAGWRELLLTHDREGDAAQFLALLFGCVAGLLFCLGGTVFADLSEMPVGLLCWLLGIAIAPTCVTTVQSGRLIAEGRAARLAQTQIVSEFAALSALVVSLFAGAGLLSLGISKLVYAVFALSTTMFATRWFGMRIPDRGEFRNMVRFTGSILMSRMIFFSQENASLLLVGVFLGPAGAGLYRAGARIAGALAEVLAQTLQIVGWTAFRQAREEAGSDPDTTHATYLKKPTIEILTVLLLVSLPAFLGLAMLAPLVIATLLGPEWKPAAAVLAMLSVRRFLIQPQSVLEPILSIIGAVRIVPRIAAINAGISLLFLVFTARHGLVPAAVGQAVAGMISVPVSFWALRTYAGVTIPALLRELWPGLIATALMLGAIALAMVSLEAWIAPSPWIQLLVCTLVGSVAYIVPIYLLMPKARRVLRTARSRLFRSSPSSPREVNGRTP